MTHCALSAAVGSVMDGKRCSVSLQNHVLETQKPGPDSPESPECLQQDTDTRNHRQLLAVSRLPSQRPRMKKQSPVPSEAFSVWPLFRLLLQGIQQPRSLLSERRKRKDGWGLQWDRLHVPEGT